MVKRAIWLAGGLCLALPLTSLLADPSVPFLLKVLVAVLMAIAAARPVAGLVLLAGLGPLAVPLIVVWGRAPLDGNGSLEAMVLAVLAGIAWRWGVLGPLTGGRLARPSLLLGVVVASSALTLLGVQQLIAGPLPAFLEACWTHVSRNYFAEPRAFPAWHAAAVWVEALLLAVMIERVVRTVPRSGHVLALVAACGLVAESAFSLLRLGQVAARSPDIANALWQHAWSTRISPHFPDVNAMGSLFALGTVCWLTIALGTKLSRWARAGALVGVAAIGAALWLTGSRAALGATAIIGLLQWRNLRRPSLNTIAALAVAGAIGVTLLTPNVMQAPRRASAATALTIRMELARVGFAMAADHPWFGVGLGEFQRQSTQYIPPSLVVLFPRASVGENAHNQLIQILAELGLVGLAAFVWYWCRLLWPAIRVGATPGQGPWRGAWAAGLGAFLVSALLGHPFLTPYVVFCVFLGVGIVAALTPEVSTARRQWSNWMLVAACVLLVVSVPSRVRSALAVPGRVLWASAVMGELDGIRYRVADPIGAWFVRATTSVIGVPVRASAESTGICSARITLDGVPADDVVVDATAWRPIRFEVEPLQSGRAHRIDVEASGAGCILLVGQIEAR